MTGVSMDADLLVKTADSAVVIELDCRWVENSGSQPFNNLYIAPRLNHAERALCSAGNGTSICISKRGRKDTARRIDSPTAPPIADLLAKTCSGRDAHTVVLQIPKADGFVAYADPWTPRVADCDFVASTHSFISACDAVEGCAFTSFGTDELAKALSAAAGATIISRPLSRESIDGAELELGRRLSFAWLRPEPVQPLRLCFLYNGAISISSYIQRWETAMALGIKLVIMSSGDWWADEHGPYAHLRDGFISIDMTPDSGFAHRIAEGVRSYPQSIDGVYAISDGLLVAVAEAAKELGLWTSGPEPYRVATNKYLTRCISNPEGLDCFKVESLNALHDRIDSGSPIGYPVVCKPVSGRGSEGVYRADNADQLSEAVASSFASRNGDTLIEPYVSGPEVDCNLVLLDGRILYSDVVDDFPSPADTAKDASGKMFTETETVIPSRLPQIEQDAIIRTAHQAVTRQGFRTGIFHCEARVMNSSMDFVYPEDGSIPELEKVRSPLDFDVKPRIFLHEVNARIPGVASSYSSLLANGVDFWALQMLCSLGDWERYESFAAPFLPGDHTEHVWLTNAMAEVTLKGLQPAFPGIPAAQLDHKLVDASCDPVKALAATHSSLTDCVLSHSGFVKDGVKYGRREGDWLWFACMVMRSPISRAHARDVAQSMQTLYRDYVSEKYNMA